MKSGGNVGTDGNYNYGIKLTRLAQVVELLCSTLAVAESLGPGFQPHIYSEL